MDRPGATERPAGAAASFEWKRAAAMACEGKVVHVFHDIRAKSHAQTRLSHMHPARCVLSVTTASLAAATTFLHSRIIAELSFLVRSPSLRLPRASPQSFLTNRERAVDYLNTRKRLYVVDGYGGWDEDHSPLVLRLVPIFVAQFPCGASSAVSSWHFGSCPEPSRRASLASPPRCWRRRQRSPQKTLDDAPFLRLGSASSRRPARADAGAGAADSLCAPPSPPMGSARFQVACRLRPSCRGAGGARCHSAVGAALASRSRHGLA